MFMPTRMNMSLPMRARMAGRISASFAWQRRAARTPRTAWSSCDRGAFQKAMMASPSNLSIVPPSSWMMSTIAVRYSLRSAVRSSGVRASEIVVKPCTSEKKIVSSRRLPARASAARDGQ